MHKNIDSMSIMNYYSSISAHWNLDNN